MVTFVPLAYPSGPFPIELCRGKLYAAEYFAWGSHTMNQRRKDRTKAVLPVKVKGKDSTGAAFEELAHTLDVTAAGARLGSIRRELNVLDEITVFYRQRKMQFRVVWVKKLKGTSEYQIGLQSLAQEKDKEGWGLGQEQQSYSISRLSVSLGMA
jgi:hypothetical protein